MHQEITRQIAEWLLSQGALGVVLVWATYHIAAVVKRGIKHAELVEVQLERIAQSNEQLALAAQLRPRPSSPTDPTTERRESL